MSAAAPNSTGAGAKKPPHILIFPYPAQGHTLPLLDLTHQLSLHNLTLTILTTPKNLSTLSPLLSTHSNIRPLIFPLPSHPSLPAGVENVKELGNTGNLPIIASLRKLYDPIIQWFRSQVNPPVALISDFFLGWTLALANEINIPRFTFYSSGAFLASVADHCWNHIDVVKNLKVVDFVDLPTTPSFNEEHLPSMFRSYDESDPDWEVVKEGSLANMSSYGCVFNSFEALEGEYLGFLKKKMGHDRVYGVGPLSLLGPDHSPRGNSGSFAHVFNWLDGCPNGSVVYVCFGTQKLMSNTQMEALATGLEMSMARFIWVVKTGSAHQRESGYGEVPDGFEDRVARRGMVVRGWAPQAKLLSHAAVGGFLSHCGWNSVLEGIASEVLILSWPMEADQFVNEKLLMDLGMAVRVCMGTDSVPDSAELGKVIGESMNGVGYEQEKRKARELKSRALGAVREGGSSLRDLKELVNELNKDHGYMN
ncbi:UDP-glucosyltransferase, putative [Ricinus communis]|uniref:UDP-glucosyltransferase, putative n=1 Tax=Ricinus communis TaxID=3988 RepID=B9RLF6_RICCO|nr:UDP-glucosyltransferase, putative [Ricinus communis]|eukprot:XP_002514575.1 UDP-glycosyltransferase 89A2 [Ricinus communis]